MSVTELLLVVVVCLFVPHECVVAWFCDLGRSCAGASPAC